MVYLAASLAAKSGLRLSPGNSNSKAGIIQESRYSRETASIPALFASFTKSSVLNPLLQPQLGSFNRFTTLLIAEISVLVIAISDCPVVRFDEWIMGAFNAHVNGTFRKRNPVLLMLPFDGSQCQPVSSCTDPHTSGNRYHQVAFLVGPYTALRPRFLEPYSRWRYS